MWLRANWKASPAPTRSMGLGGGYDFAVPLIDGDHVTDDAGTGFVHTAPGHGREDFEAWMDTARDLEARGISSAIPFTVDDAGYYTKDAPGFGPDREGGPARVIDDKGKKGDANQAVITALIEPTTCSRAAGSSMTYPHSWRSKKPVIFRNTPQWFVHMDKDFGDGTTLRSRALKGIDDTRFVPCLGPEPPARHDRGPARLGALAPARLGRADLRLRRCRWQCPLRRGRSTPAFSKPSSTEGADAWFAEGARERFLGNDASDPKWIQVTDILDVWFDSGSTHVFTLEDRPT
jgi:isoleucyl-tRNA synthetase